MISRKGTRTSVASSGVTQILREAGRGPVVTAGRGGSGLERMFMAYPRLCFCEFSPSLRAQRSNPAFYKESLDCFVATLLAMTAERFVNFITRPPRSGPATAAPVHPDRHVASRR